MFGIRKKNIEDENRKRLRKIQEGIKSQNCPDRWEYKKISVGGLTEVGFSEQNDDLLLIISGNGRGLFDCSRLELVDRDDSTDFDIDYFNLACQGIGIVKNEKIEIAGLRGGGLPVTNSQGDSLEIMTLDWPKTNIIFQLQWSSIYMEKNSEKCFNIYSTETLRAYGFSKNRKYLVISTSSELLIFKR